MSEKRWTLLLLGDEKSSVRQISVSRRTVRASVTGALVLVLTVLGAAVYLAVEGSARLRAESLQKENQVLTSRLQDIQSRVGELETRFGSLSETGSHFRTLAGLEPIDSEILEVGVGGPGARSPADDPLWSIDPEAGSMTFAVEYDLGALERRARLLSESLGEATDSLMAHRDLLKSTPSILPTAGVLSSRFSQARYHPIHHRPLPHEGVDISAEKGTPVLAAAKGTVRRARWASGYGEMVEIDHGYGFVTLYGHASKLLVREGQEVERGDVIAQVGRSGIATSPHLHYEVRIDGRPVNPMNHVLDGSIP